MLEGLAYNGNPQFNIVDLVYPYVVSMVLTGSPGTPFRTSLRNLVVDSSGGPGTERLQLIALERLVRLSRPGALIHASSATGAAAEARTPCEQSSVVRYAISEEGRFVRELAVGQYSLDMVALCNAWQDRVLFRRRNGGGTDGVVDERTAAARANVAVVHRVLRRERRGPLGLLLRLRLARLTAWTLASIGLRVAVHFVRRVAAVVLRRPPFSSPPRRDGSQASPSG
jgi:hypothetical protein